MNKKRVRETKDSNICCVHSGKKYTRGRYYLHFTLLISSTLWNKIFFIWLDKCLFFGFYIVSNVFRKKARERKMSLPKNLQDCYFFYYSACRKGTSCQYRHCPAALGHERTCAKFKLGQCLDANCQDRHMVIEKTRSKIQCYWESKPSGCCKPHCVFKHIKRQNNNNVTTTATIETPEAISQSVESATASV
ncbi:zinc finger CCCH domain-containing protein 11B-like [Contarinia nasturtii]|uniref:zinc finger CCCH domain-containing protein 11B-like n=1 Tax=Contarinia nasturtii TaxID=265458 RepID=UPI0012D3C209|nr:zinc finger CCCH domain-containing protein 11B-like [Contarinia nasturtii]